MLTTTQVRGKPLTEAEIVDIISKNSGFRKKDSMSNEIFLYRFREIVPEGSAEDVFGIVTPSTAARICRLRVEYENLPPGPGGFRPQYSPDSLRGQKKSNNLRYLTKQEVKEVFGEPFPRTSWLWLEDILCKPLGRWPKEKRAVVAEKKPRGRPRKHRPVQEKRQRGRPRKDVSR